MRRGGAAWQLAKRAAWSLPLAVTFTDCVASIIRCGGGSALASARPRQAADPAPDPAPACRAAHRPRSVDGASMQPALNPGGLDAPSDWVLVEKLSIKLLQHYTRGEVVVLWCARPGAARSPTARPAPAAQRRDRQRALA